MKKNKYSVLFSNVYLFAIGELITKLITFILIPIYTNYMGSGDYGISDLIISTIALIIPLLTIASTDVTLQFSIDNNVNKNELLSIIFKRIALSLIMIIIPTYFILLYYNLQELFLLVIIIYTFTALRSNCSQFAKGIDKTKAYVISSIVASVLLLGANFIFICYLDYKIFGFLLSIAISETIGFFTLFFIAKIYKYVDFKKNNNLDLRKETFNYGLPLVPNKIFWWITNLSDRYMLVYFSGASISGLYTAASKLPNIYNVFITIFMQAWTVSAIKEKNDDEKEKFYEKVFNYFQLFSMALGSFIILNINVIGSLLYKKEFIASIDVIPIILLGIIYNSFGYFFGSILLAFRESKIIFKTTMFGAIFNIVFNILFIKYLGMHGAAISTLISYILIMVIRYFYTKKFVKLKISFKKILIGTIIIFIQFALILLKIKYTYFINLLLFVIYISVNYKDLLNLINFFINKFFKKNSLNI